jgi:hypothetical protein
MGGVSVEQILAWFCKLCVAIYAFISGYGMSRIFKKKFDARSSLSEYLKGSYLAVGKYLLRFLKKYWLVFILFIPLGFAFGALGEFNAKDFLLCFTGVRTHYNGEWWYVRQYIFMIVLLPALHLFFDFFLCKNRRNWKVFLVGVLMAAAYIGLYYFLSANKIYTIIFAIGYVCARFNVFEFLNKFLVGKLKYLVGIVIIIGCMVVRMILANEAAYNRVDVFVAPLFVFAVYLLTQKENIVNKGLAWLGKYSVYMWLTHTFYCYYYFQNIITFSKISTVMYIELFVVSLLTAMALSAIEKLLDRYVIQKIQEKIAEKSKGRKGETT